VVVPSQKFKGKSNVSAVRCSWKANDGYLYILEKSFFFIRKPPIFIRHADVTNIEFARLTRCVFVWFARARVYVYVRIDMCRTALILRADWRGCESSSAGGKTFDLIITVTNESAPHQFTGINRYD